MNSVLKLPYINLTTHKVFPIIMYLLVMPSSAIFSISKDIDIECKQSPSSPRLGCFSNPYPT